MPMTLLLLWWQHWNDFHSSECPLNFKKSHTVQCTCIARLFCFHITVQIIQYLFCTEHTRRRMSENPAAILARARTRWLLLLFLFNRWRLAAGLDGLARRARDDVTGVATVAAAALPRARRRLEVLGQTRVLERHQSRDNSQTFVKLDVLHM